MANQPVQYFVTASELYTAYYQNEVDADSRFRGRVIQVTGTVDRIDEDVLGDTYITLKNPEDKWTSIQCYFPEGRRSELARLESGQIAHVKGVCYGKSVLNVLVKGCTLQ